MELTPQEAFEHFRAGEAVFLDVRTGMEWLGGHIPGAVHIPLEQLGGRCEELDPGQHVVVVCSHGIRGAAAGRLLAEAGFRRVANVRHGICRWPGPLEFGI